jgi:hypothetical protein
VMIGGACFIVAALLVTRVDDAVSDVVVPAGAQPSIDAPPATAHI